MALDLEGRDPVLVAAAVIFGAAALVMLLAGAVAALFPFSLAAALVGRSAPAEVEARREARAERARILAGLEARDAALARDAVPRADA